MANYMDILPDPTNKILDSGLANASGTAGPGFASVKFSSKQPTVVDRTHSGRVITRAIQGQNWDIAITYNPLTRAEFEPVNSFLMAMQGSLKPFFVYLPQYLTSQDATFAADNDNTSPALPVTVDESNGVAAGRTYIQVAYSGNGSPRPGDLFNIIDSTNSNHVKTYMVTRYETASSHDSDIGTLSGSQKRISFNPPLQYSVPNAKELEFTNPKVRVINTGRAQEYSLNTNNLFKFGLKLEEALP